MQNSEYLIINKKTSRFSGCDWYEPFDMPDVFILGCGNLGSWVALDLARKGCKLHLYDFDKVEEENIGCQFYSENNIGSLKTEHTKANCIWYSGNENIYTYDKYEEDSMTNPIIFCCVDSMEIRRIAFKKWLEQEDREIFIDTRNALELTEIYCVAKREDEERYIKTLYSDEQSNESPCNLKSTGHACFIGTGLMTGTFCNYLANKNLGYSLREVPFYQSFETPFCKYECII